MALIALVVAIVVGGLFYFGGAASGTPEQVVNRYLDGWGGLDLEKVMGTIKPSLRETARPNVEKEMKGRRSQSITRTADNRKLRVENQQKEECRVVASYQMTVTQGGQSRQTQVEEQYHMVLVDRQWYIDSVR